MKKLLIYTIMLTIGLENNTFSHQSNDIKPKEKIVISKPNFFVAYASILFDRLVQNCYSLYIKHYPKKWRYQRTLANSLSKGEITINIRSLCKALSEQTEFYLGSVELYATTINFFQKHGLDINNLYTMNELGANQKDSNNFTLLMIFSTYGPIVKACLQCNANILIQNNQNLTALDFFVNDFMKLKKAVNFNCGLHYFAFEALLALLQASTNQERCNFFEKYMPIHEFPTINKSSYIDFYNSDMGHYNAKESNIFTSCNFTEAFLYMLPRIPSKDAKELLTMYLNSLTKENKLLFKIKIQGLLDFINSKEVRNAYREDETDTCMHNPQDWIDITDIINNLN